jgi:hypothetical protein
VDAHGLERLDRGILAPQRHRQPLCAHRVVRAQEQRCQQCTALLTAQPGLAAARTHFERTEDPELHVSPLLEEDAIASR